MIDEALEVQDYLAGKNISTRYMYHICFLLAKWFYQQGHDADQIAEDIFAWANQYHIRIECDVYDLIRYVLRNNTEFRTNIVIQINKNDIEEIDKRLGKPDTVLSKTTLKLKKVALAIICWAKATADENEEFSLPLGVMSKWVGVDYVALRKHWLVDLCNVKLMKEINQDSAIHPAHWNQYYMSRNLRFRMLIPLANEGIYQLHDNNIQQLFDDIYTKNT